MKYEPKISVVIPTLNEENYLEALLKSIKRQSYKNYEIIVSDCKSTDNTLKIARRYGAIIKSAAKKGAAAGRNAGMLAAGGDIIAFIDADYVLSKTLFDSIVKAFERNPSAVCVEPRVVLNPGEIAKKYRLKFKVLCRLINAVKRFSFSGPFPWAFSCDFCRKNIVRRTGSFKENLFISEDTDFFARMKKLGNFILIPDTAQMSFRRELKYGFVQSVLSYVKGSISVLTKNNPPRLPTARLPKRLRATRE